ncbi:hypothetical protein P7F88_25265, partial [Vibrio hannami]
MASKTERSNNEKYLFNVSELAKAFSRSPNTVKKAIEVNHIKPTKTVGNRIYYHIAEVAPYLVQNKAGVQGRKLSIDEGERKRVQDIVAVYGSLKDFKEYKQALLAETNEQIKSGEYTEAADVALVFGRMIGEIQGHYRRLPNVCEAICTEWTRAHSEEFAKQLIERFDAITHDIVELANDCD